MTGRDAKATMDDGLPRALGDELVLRRARATDRDAVAEFHATWLVEPDEEAPADRLAGASP